VKLWSPPNQQLAATVSQFHSLTVSFLTIFDFVSRKQQRFRRAMRKESAPTRTRLRRIDLLLKGGLFQKGRAVCGWPIALSQFGRSSLVN
jgi:hypothetical protein